MGLFDKLFGKKSAEPEMTAPAAVPPAAEVPADSPMMKVFDPDGNEVLVPREQWRDVLLANLESQVEKPEELYNTLLLALREGFAADVIPYAEYFMKIDPIPTRGAVTLGILYMEADRLEDAERVFNDFTIQHGPQSIILTNLAKLHSRRGDDEGAESILWNALEVDPNNENAVGWYVAIQQERDGEEGVAVAYRRIATIRGSWRAQLWLARTALEAKDLFGAEKMYQEAIDSAGSPIPTNLLLQMSGDLGNSGYLEEIDRLVAPHVDPAVHGLDVGNNVIKANLELGRFEQAKAMLDRLQGQNRPEWHPTLRFWYGEIVRAEEAKGGNS